MIKRIKEYYTITATIELLSGLHIGGSKDTIEIGGNDQPIIRNPLNNEPYIPGSSLKGKMRTLLEWNLGLFDKSKGDPCTPDIDKDRHNLITRIFGTLNKQNEVGPTRIIVNDAYLTHSWSEKIKNKRISLTEDKYENSIDRRSGTAKHPRPIERVVPGVEFEFKISYRVFELENRNKESADKENIIKEDSELFDYVLYAIYLLEKDYLGGSGSRGCGKIKFKNIKINSDNYNDMDEVFQNRLKQFLEKEKVI